MVDSFEKSVSYRLSYVAKLHRARAAALLSEIHLYPGQETILKSLVSRDGQTMGELALALSVRPPTITKMVSRLSAQGLVERRSSDGDGRLGRVFLTQQGRVRTDEIDDIWRKLEKRSLSGLDTKERKRLRKLLRQVGKNLSNHEDSSAMDDEHEDDVVDD